jgi:hypothetical protein
MSRITLRAAIALAAIAAFAPASALASSDPYMAGARTNMSLTDGHGCQGAFDPSNPMAPLGEPAGFVTAVPQGDGTIQVNVHLRNLLPNTVYAISDACQYNTGYTFTTNDQGVGNASISLPQNGQTYWVFDGLAGGGSCCSFFGLDYWESLPIILP